MNKFLATCSGIENNFYYHLLYFLLLNLSSANKSLVSDVLTVTKFYSITKYGAIGVMLLKKTTPTSLNGHVVDVTLEC